MEKKKIEPDEGLEDLNEGILQRFQFFSYEKSSGILLERNVSMKKYQGKISGRLSSIVTLTEPYTIVFNCIIGQSKDIMN